MKKAGRVAVERIAVGIGEGEIGDPGPVDVNYVAAAHRGVDRTVWVETQVRQSGGATRPRQRPYHNVVVVGVPRLVRSIEGVLAGPPVRRG